MQKKKFFSRDLIFYIVMLAFPVLQFCIFYIGVNGRSFLYSFQKIENINNTFVSSWSFDSIKSAFQELTSPDYLNYFKNSFLTFLICYFIGTILALFFSYFIYKKLPLNGLFKVFLFLPSIISGIVLCVMFKSFVNDVLPAMFNNGMKGLFDNKSTIFPTLIVYNIFISFGTSVLMYSNAMSGISPEIIEASKIDGASPVREFFSVIVPSIFPTISTFAITSVAAIFVNQLSCFAFFGTSLDRVQNGATIGYALYVGTVSAGSDLVRYPKLSAIGFLLTLIAVPVTLLVKYLLDKYGPSEK